MHNVIRPQLWIHWCVVVLCLGCWGGMLYVGDLVEQSDVGLKTILGIRSGRLANFFSTIMLLWAGQLALLIYWFRRKSRNDFHGRYRQWMWVGVTLQFFLAVVATEAHRPFGDYMQRMWTMNVPQYELLSWLVPTSTIALAMFRLLSLEMRNCSSSRTLLWIAGLSGVTAAVSLVIGAVLPQRPCDLLQVGSATLAHLGLASALLFHARYVIHVSNEAPAVSRKAAILSRMIGGLMTALRRSAVELQIPRWNRSWRRKQAPAAAPAKAARKSADAKPALQPAAATQAASAPLAAPAARTLNSERITPPEKPKSAAVPELKRRIDAAEALKGPRRSPVLPVEESADDVERDAAPDEHSLAGLSRKERKRLRKAQQNAPRHAPSAR
ncbi:MAG: hypothetical protein AB7U20_06185 [Planctomycetaceae bacterium]